MKFSRLSCRTEHGRLEEAKSHLQFANALMISAFAFGAPAFYGALNRAPNLTFFGYLVAIAAAVIFSTLLRKDALANIDDHYSEKRSATVGKPHGQA